MKSDTPVATPPPKPLLVYDGDCHFCRLWVGRGQRITGPSVDYLPSQHPEISRRFPEIPRQNYDRAVQLIDVDGSVYSGAEAVFRTLAANPNYGWPLRAYQSVQAIATITEGVYNFVANHRPVFSRLTRWLWGRHVERPEHIITRWFFLRALGIIYLFAFLSLGMQVQGLIGPDGILPADHFLSMVKAECDIRGIGVERYGLVPTLCWLSASGTFLKVQCAAGVVIAMLLVIDLAPALCLGLLWLLYLSLATVGQDFLGFQWDNLLLEAGFLAIFLAPPQWLPGVSGGAPPSRIVLWLCRLLLFKLMFSSGCVKLLSHDPNWRNLSALSFHYLTQPLPTWLAWYASQLPLWFQKISCAIMFGIEIGAPFLIFGPRRIRLLGVSAIALLQCLILLTGNYTFFNFLALTLCLLLLDDFAFQNWLLENIHGWFNAVQRVRRPKRCWPGAVTIPLAVVILAVSSFQVISLFGVQSSLLAPLAYVDAEIEPLRTVNSYGLFAVMTTTRNEIIVEGSDDGVRWLPYEFKYKPGDLKRYPAFVAPFQPRLDWQMWFAALGNYQQNPWFESFCERLLQGSAPVLALLQKNPFPQHPPKYIRAELFEYRFSTLAERRATGAWWQRQSVGEYLPPAGLSPGSGPP
jgi:predicted DCC family thiol-disulfide oxidoreductase YuxK